MRARRILAALGQYTHTQQKEIDRTTASKLSELRITLTNNEVPEAQMDQHLDSLGLPPDLVTKLKNAPPLDPKTLLELAHEISQQENPDKEQAAKIIAEMDARGAVRWGNHDFAGDAALDKELLKAQKDLQKIVDDVFNMPDNKYRILKLIEEYKIERSLPVSFRKELEKCTTEQGVYDLVEGILPSESLENKASVDDLNAGNFLGANLSYEQFEKFKLASLPNQVLIDNAALTYYPSTYKKCIQEIHARFLREDRPNNTKLAIEIALESHSKSPHSARTSQKILNSLSDDLNKQVEKIDQYINNSLKELIFSKAVKSVLESWTHHNQSSSSSANLESISANSKRIVNLNKNIKSLTHETKETQKNLNTAHAVLTTIISLMGIGLAYTIPKMIASKKKHGTVFFTHVTPKVVLKHATEELQGKPEKPRPRR
jgi:hypothetical protein